MSKLSTLLNSPWHGNLMIVTDAIIQASHEFFRAAGYVHGNFPVTTQSVSSPMGASSDSLPVEALIGDRKHYLADSMQFCLELGCRVSGKPAYYVMPSARGENPDHRHLTEFLHIEMEIFGTLGDVMSEAERYILSVVRRLRETVSDEISSLVGDLTHVDSILSSGAPFKRVTFSDAVVLAREKGCQNAFEPLADGSLRITPEGEAFLLETLGDFTWLTHLPFATVPFYQKRSSDPAVAQSADLLAGIGEILGCGERVRDEREALENLSAQGVPIDHYQWYCEMKALMPVQTAGFGMGLERLLMWLLHHRDIRELTLLRRDWREKQFP